MYLVIITFSVQIIPGPNVNHINGRYQTQKKVLQRNFGPSEYNSRVDVKSIKSYGCFQFDHLQQDRS